MERPGSHVAIHEFFQSGIQFEGDFDVDWFCKVTSETVARKRLEFLRTPKNIFELRRRGYGGPALDRMWRAVLRGCLSFQVPIPSELHHHASELGIIIP